MRIPTRCVAETRNLGFEGQKLIWEQCKRRSVMTREGYWGICRQHGKAEHFNPHPDVVKKVLG